LRLEYVLHPSWPALAWLARCERGGARIVVHHGSSVEVNTNWFAEAVWDGDYVRGGFDETDVVFGSGARLRDASCVFVSSASTVDRLNCLHTRDAALISNSLPCLLEYADAAIDPAFPRYYEHFYSICEGLEKYQRRLATSAGAVELTYFDNLRWDGAQMLRVAKPGADRRFDDFTAYARFLQDALRGLSANMRSVERKTAYRMLGTLSTGYDSPTIAALARAAGMQEVLCFDRAHTGEEDSGEIIALHLGLKPVRLQDRAWRALEAPEIPFLCSNSMGEEVRFRAGERYLAARVLLTGYHGDKMWDLHTSKLGPDIVRGDPSGLSLTEYRLWAGFIHCPVAFLGVRQIGQINRISRSAELRPWDVGGAYTRPICRRIVEDAGVPRTAFGMHKRNASVMLHNYDEFLTPSSRRDYLDWLRRHRGEWVRRGRLPPLAFDALDRATRRASDAMAAWLKGKPLLWRLGQAWEGVPTPMRRPLFPWAIERGRARYRTG
jgi:hypothetical protein